MHFSGVTVSELINVWPQLFPSLDELLARCPDKRTVEHVNEAIKERNMQLWVEWNDTKVNSFAITQIVVVDEEKTCHILYACGKFTNNWLICNYIIMRWAAQLGCQSIRLQGRKAWAKTLKPLGYKITSNINDFYYLRAEL